MRGFWRSRKWPVWLGGAFAVALLVFGASDADRLAARLNTVVFDSYQQLRPREWSGSPVTIVDIDERSLEEIGQWPWPRDLMARLTDRMMDLGAATVVFDIVFAEPDNTSPGRVLERMRAAGATVEVSGPATLDNDAVFADAIARSNVVLGIAFADAARGPPPSPKVGTAAVGTDAREILPDRQRAISNLEAFDAAAAGLGFINPELGADGVVRRVPLVFHSNGELQFALAIEALRVAQGAGSVVTKASDGSGEGGTGAGTPVLTGVRVGAFETPTDKHGEVRVYHSRLAAKPIVSMARLLGGRIDPGDADALAGRIVLVGTSAPGLLDLRATPIDAIVPGVAIHADVIDQIMSGRALVRPDWAEGAEITAAIGLGLLAVAIIPFFTPLAHALFATLLIVSTAFTSWWLFLSAPATEAFSGTSLLVSPLLPAGAIFAGYATASGVQLLITERDERFVRRAFGLYLAPAMVDRLAEAPGELKLGGEERELTLLFCDIRGFTTLSEGLDPVELTTLLNDFLTPMTRALMERGATIDKYMGDAIMAFWNAPVPQPDHAGLAVVGLLEMRDALEALNRRNREAGRREISIGVGLNTGPCCVGNLGSEQRFNYSAIGDAVNVASRIEGLTKQYGLTNLVAAETVAQAMEQHPRLAHLEVDRVGVIGRTEPLVVHTVLSLERERGFAKLRAAHERFLTAWRKTDGDATRDALEAARSLAPESLHALYELFGHRLDQRQRDGWPEGWDGVTRATSK